MIYFRNHRTGRPCSFDNSVPIPTLKIGTATNNSEFEADGTLKFNGDATIYNDIQFDMTPKATGAGHPSLVAFKTDFEEFRWSVGDHSNGRGQEMPHWWKEGTNCEFHIHWSTGSGNYVSGDRVNWRLKVTSADMAIAAPYTAFSATQTYEVEHIFSTTVAPWSHVYSSFGTWTIPAGLTKIGAQVKVYLERIAKTAGTDPGTDPFVLQVGCHAIQDTIGSRTTSGK